jgi:hypothetical protein
MSNSFRKYCKVKIKGCLKDVYWSIVRSRQKQEIRAGKDISQPKEIVNDYNYTDYTSNCERRNDCPCMKMFGRKRCLNK